MRAVAVVLLAALGVSGALPAAAAPAETRTVTGSVTVAGRPVPGVLVGTWNPDRGIVARALTDARGMFRLRTPAHLEVEAFAGHDPQDPHAVFAVGSEHLVTGLIGGAAPSGTPAALLEQVRAVAPERLGGGRPLRFELQRAGRFAASVPEGGSGAISVERDGLEGTTWRAKDGVTTSGWLVPGRYRLLWDARSPRLSARTSVVVRSGVTTAAPPPVLPTGTTVHVRVVVGGGSAPAGVAWAEEVPGFEGGTTDGSGSFEVTGVPPGRHRYRIADQSAGLPALAGLLPSAVDVRVRAGQPEARVTVALAPAARITGSVSPRRRGVSLIAVDQAGAWRGAAESDASGDWGIDGLRAGRYTVLAHDPIAHRWNRVGVEVAAGGTAAVPTPMRPRSPDPVLTGSVVGARRGVVVATVDRAGKEQQATYGYFRGGAYRLPVLPGRFRLRVFAEGRASSEPVEVRLSESTRRDLAVGPENGRARATFVVRGHRIRPRFSVSGPGPRPPLEVQELSRWRAIRFDRSASGGASVTGAAAPGRYTWEDADPTRGDAVPAVDGPWWFAAPVRGFALRSGGTTDLGEIPVRIGR